MDRALAVAAGQAPGPDQILSVAGRLTREAEPDSALPAARGPGGMLAWSPPRDEAVPDNMTTLQACRGLLSRTLDMLG